MLFDANLSDDDYSDGDVILFNIIEKVRLVIVADKISWYRIIDYDYGYIGSNEFEGVDFKSQPSNNRANL